jgi:hypothetical protein
METQPIAPTKRDQIVFAVISEITSPLHVMDIQVGHGSAALAAPLIALQDPQTELRVRFWIHSNRMGSLPNRARDLHSASRFGLNAGTA